MPGPDRIVLIPRLKPEKGSGLECYETVLNLRMQQVLSTCADLSATQISINLSRGLDAQGQPLPPLSKATVRRREQNQRAGGGDRGGMILDTDTPMYETGQLAESLKITGRKSDEVRVSSTVKGGRRVALYRPDGPGQRIMEIPQRLAAPGGAFDRIIKQHGDRIMAEATNKATTGAIPSYALWARSRGG